MSRRELLTEDERAQLFGVPVDEASLARHYTLSPYDLEHLLAKRGARNILGAAVQLALLRHPGFGLRSDAGKPRAAPPLSGWPQQGRGPAFSGACDICAPAGSDHRPHVREPELSRLRSQSGHRGDRVLEHGLHGAGCRAPENDGCRRPGPSACPHLTVGLVAHQPDRRLPVGAGRDRRRRLPAAQHVEKPAEIGRLTACSIFVRVSVV
jgi:Domain of unknown function (DUF4158)